MAASNLVAFWHIATILPPEIGYSLGPDGRNETCEGRFSGNSSILVAIGDSLRLQCRSDRDVAWIRMGEEKNDEVSQTWIHGNKMTEIYFSSIDHSHVGTYACLISDLFPATVASKGTISSQIAIKISLTDQNPVSGFKIIRHTPPKVSIDSGNQINICVDFLLPQKFIEETKLQSRNFAENFAKNLWQLPDQLAAKGKESGINFKTVLHFSGDMNGELSTCIRVSNPILGEYRIDLSNISTFNTNRSEHLTENLEKSGKLILKPEETLIFKVEAPSRFNSSTEKEGKNSSDIRLLTGSVYQFTCHIVEKDNGMKISHESYVHILESVDTGQHTMSWCDSSFEIHAVSILGSTSNQNTNSYILVAQVFVPPVENSNLTAPTTGSITCSRPAKTRLEGRREEIIHYEPVSTLKYTIFDDEKFIREQNDLLIEAEIGDGYTIIAPHGRPIALPQGARMVLKCYVQRCLFGEMKWMKQESHEVFGYVNAQSDHPELEILRDGKIDQKVARNDSLIRNGSDEITSRFYASSPRTLVLEIVFPVIHMSQAGTFACMVSSDRSTWKKSTVKVQVRPRPTAAKGRSLVPSALHVVAIPPLEVPPTTKPRVPISHQLAESLCSENIKHIVIAVTVAAIASLLLVAFCSLAVCYRLNKANILTVSSMVIKTPSKKPRLSVKQRLIGINSAALATEEEMSI